jgi:DNA primase
MPGPIPKSFIDDLLARTDIVSIIEGSVQLRKSGGNHKGLCPFHEEKTPSFTVSQDKQFYHCFGCGANGTAITFLMEYRKMDFVSAVEELAGRIGLQVPREGGGAAARDQKLTELYELHELAVQFYRKQLKQHPDAHRAVEYLKRRGITGELAAKFELGYAPAGWDNLIKALGQSDPAQHRLAKAGLIIQRDQGGYYDRFRDRIMFPIRDQRGRVVGFGGRVLDDGTPKYLNSPETPIFHKGRELYGLYQARHAVKNLQRLYVVEGYMDVLALVQHGVNNAVATLGTAATTEHLETIFRVTPEIVFCFDGDEAGRRAAWRALEISMPVLRDGRRVFFMFMPEDQDPDDFIRQYGNTSFADIKRYVPLTDYLLRELTKDFDPEIREHKSKLIHDVTPYLRKLPQGALKLLLIEDIAGLAGVEKSTIAEQLMEHREKPADTKVVRPRGKADRTLLAQVIKMLLSQPKVALSVPDNNTLSELTLPGTEFLKELIQLIQKYPDITLARILEYWRGTKYEKRLSELAPITESPYERDDAVFHSEEFLASEFKDALAKLRELSRRQKVKELGRNLNPSELSEERKNALRNLNPAARAGSEK